MKAKHVENHFDEIALEYDHYKKKNWYYYKRLKRLLKSLIPSKATILEVGCGTGDVLSSLDPLSGVGMDVSREMVRLAKAKHPDKNLSFFASDIVSYSSKKEFDYIIMSDVIEHLSDVTGSLRAIKKLMNKKTVFVNTMANPIWEPILMLAEKLHLKMPEGPHHRITYKELENLSKNEGLCIIKHGYDTLCPIYIPILTDLLNLVFEPVCKPLAFIEYTIFKIK